MGPNLRVRRWAVILIAALSLPHFAAPAHAAITSRGQLFRLSSKIPASYPGSGTLWKDLSGNGYDATLMNGANTTCSTPYAGANVCTGVSSGSESVTSTVRMPAMQFYNQTTSTTGKYATMKNGASIAWGAFTGFSATFYANFGTTNSGWDRILDFGSGSGTDNIEVARNGSSNSLTLEIWNGGASYGYCSTANSILNNTWAHYAIVADGSNCAIYRDNVKLATQSYSGIPTNVTRLYNYIARSNWSADSLFSGGIADLAVYNLALTDAEVSANFTEQTVSQILSISSTAPSNATFGGANYSIVDTSTSQLAPVHSVDPTSTSVCSVSGNTVSFIGAGNCKINITQPGNANYSSAPTALSQSFTVTGQATMTFSVASTATYRQALGLSVSVNAAGKVTFYSQGKVIPGCKNLAVTTTATCNWKPAQHSTVKITAAFTPTNVSLTPVSKDATVVVAVRGGNR